MIDLANVSFAYREGASAVRSVSAAIRAGELVSLIGPNGAGKSTLLKLLARVLLPTSGSIEFRGRPLASWKPRDYAREVGYLPQHPEPSFPMRAIDVVLSGRAPFLGRFEWESEGDRERAVEALARCDARGLADRFLDEMSGGERKRVFLARVLVGEPRLVLLDEPLSELDIAHIESFTRLLRRIVDQSGAAVVFISHDLNWSAAWSDRMMVLKEGELALDGTPGEVMRPAVMKAVFGFDGLSVAAEGRADRQWIVPDLGRS